VLPTSLWDEPSYIISGDFAAQEATPTIARKEAEEEQENLFCYEGADEKATEQQISPIISVAPGREQSSEPEMRSLAMQFAGACDIGGATAKTPIELEESVSQKALLQKAFIPVDHDDHADLRAENAVLRAELGSARRQIEELIQSSTSAKEEVIKYSTRNEALERKCAEHNEIISSSYAKLVAVVAELEESRERLAAAEALSRCAADAARSAQTRVSESLLQCARSEATAAEYARQIDVLKRDALKKHGEFNTLESRLSEQGRQLAVLKSKSTELEKEIMSKNALVYSLKAEIRDFEEAACDLKSQVSGLTSEMQTRMAEIDTLRESEAAVKRQSADMAAKLSRVKARRNEFKNLLENERSESLQLRNKLHSSEQKVEELQAQILDMVTSLQASREETASQRQLAEELAKEVAKHKDVIMYINRISSESSRRDL
jgi:chromosome segregation ATPase